MNIAIFAAVSYGILAIAGGLMGYVKAQSKISLFSGSGSGIVILLAALASALGQSWGLLVCATVTGILILTFLVRLIKTRKVMPATLMIGLGIPALLLMAWGS